MKLYYHPRSPYARKVLFAAYSKGIEFERVVVPPGQWRDQAKAMGQVYEIGLTPALVLPAGVTLAESGVIVEYLDSVVAAPRLVPVDPVASLRVRMLDRIVDACVTAPAGKLYFVRAKTKTAEDRPEYRAGLVDRVNSALRYVELQLESSAPDSRATYLGGETACLADVSVCVGIEVWKEVGGSMAEFEMLEALYQRLVLGAAWKRVVAESALTEVAAS